MKKRYMTLVELSTTISVMAIMLSYTGFTWNTAFKTKVKLEKKRAQTMNIERTADKIRSFTANFTSATEISPNQVQSGLFILKVDKNSLSMTDTSGVNVFDLPEGTSVRFRPYQSALKEPMLLTEIIVKNDRKTSEYSIKTRLNQ